MASNPYGITQVDVPGILNAYQSARQARVQDMLLQRQIAKEDAAADRENKTRIALAKVFAPQAASGDTSGAVTSSTAVAPSGPQMPSTLVDPAHLPPRTDGLSVNQDALRELYAVDPATAMELQKSVYNMDKQKHEQMTQNAEALASIAYGLKQVPPEQRANRLSQWSGALRQMGIPPEAINGADLSDNALDGYIYQAQKVGDLITANKPQIISQSPGEVTQSYDPRTGKMTEIGRSPIPRIIIGADGQQYAVDAAGAGAPIADTSGPSPQSPKVSAPPAAVDYLRKNPQLAPQFDAKYGPGASKSILGGAPSQGGATFPSAG